MYILLIILSITLAAQSNKNIEIINADHTFADINKHPEYWRLIGNVSFKHNNAMMHCDSAYHFTNTNKIKAFGKIKIVQGDTLTLTGKKLTYSGTIAEAEMQGNVKLVDKHMTLTTEKIFYNLNTNIASYPSNGTITEEGKTISSKKGEYHSNIHRFIFKDSVRVSTKEYNIITNDMHYNSESKIANFFGSSYIISKEKTIYCENGWYDTHKNISKFKKNAYIKSKNQILKGDSIYYNQNTGYGKAINNVIIIDTLEGITVYGDLAEYFEKNEIIEITKNPWLQILFEKDTLFMYANTFISKQKLGEKKILAYDKVKFFKPNLQGKSDSLCYNFSNSTIQMFNKPVLWSDNFQITADSIDCLIKQKKINHMLLRPNPMIISKEDSLNYNQIKGKNMIAYFEENNINRIDIKGNGQSIFIVEDEESESNKKIGLNYTEGTNLKLYFKNNQLESVNYETQPKSTTTPYSNIKEEERYLKGFNWREKEQPKNKNDIFNE